MKIEEVCRCCLSENVEMLNIHSSIECQNTEEVIYTMLTWSFNIQILPDDDLPHNICLQCLNILKDAYIFKKTMEKSKKILLQQLENSKNLLDLSDDEPLFNMLKNSNNDTELHDSTINEEYLDENYDEICSNKDKNKQTKETFHKSSYKDISNKYYCTECPAKFSDPSEMFTHCEKTHEANEFGRSCDLCNQRYSDFKTLIEHRKKHFHPYVCPICWGGYYNESDFTSHVANCKPKVDEEPPVVDGTRKMTMCHVCGKSYPTTYITLHMKIHKEGTYSCSHCGKRFKQPTALGSHIIWNHKKVKKHKCMYCDLLFMTASAKSAHVREKHLKERNVACETCGKLFFSNSRLKMHSRTHTGEKFFACNLCDKSYQSRNGLNVHMKSHNLIKSVGA